METFNLDDARARRLEASGNHLEFTFGGEQFTIPPTMEWDLAVPELMADGKIKEAMAALLGDQADRFMGKKPTLGDIEALSSWLSTAAMGGSGN